MAILKADETLIVSDHDVTIYTKGMFPVEISKAYDLLLVSNTAGKYILIVHMELQFIFKDKWDVGWKKGERSGFIRDFKKIINNVWGNNRPIGRHPDGHPIYVDYRFTISRDLISYDEHWEIHVDKISTANKYSYVDRGSRRVHLDCQDFTFTSKDGRRLTQRGAVHEFGHMIGLDDISYSKMLANPHLLPTAMSKGEQMLPEYYAEHIYWLRKLFHKFSHHRNHRLAKRDRRLAAQEYRSKHKVNFTYRSLRLYLLS